MLAGLNYLVDPSIQDQDRRLIIDLDLGDRSSFYCVLDEAGEVLMEQRLSIVQY